MNWLIPCAAAVVCLTGPARADQTSERALANSADLAMSERLEAFTRARALENAPGDIITAQGLKDNLVSLGFYVDETRLSLLSWDWSFAPTLAYDPNINGGFPNRILDLGGLILELNPGQLAIDGVTVGASGSLTGRLAWQPGRYFEAGAQAAASYAPEVDLSRTDTALSVCARNHLFGWTFADVCRRDLQSVRELGTGTLSSNEIAIAHLFRGTASNHEIWAAFGQEDSGDEVINYGGARIDSVWPRLGTRFSIGMTEGGYGSVDDGYTVSGFARWHIGDRMAGAGLTYLRPAPTNFVGLLRDDDVFSASAFYEVMDDVVVTLSVVDTRSSIDFFTDTQIGFDVSFQFD